MKILILTHAQYITVALPKIIEFAEALSPKVESVTLVATSIKNRIKIERFKKNGVEYILTPSILFGRLRHGADIWDVLNRIIVLRNSKFDIVHAIDSRPTVILPALYLKKKNRYPLVLEWSDLFGTGGTIKDRSGHLYSYTFGKIEKFFEEFFRLKADISLAISRNLLDRLIELGFPKRKIFLYKMGSKYTGTKILSKIDARKRLSLKENSIILGYFGRINKYDHELLVKSFSLFQKKNNYSLVFLYIIGDVSPLDKDKNDNIKYMGKVDDDKYKLFLDATDVFLLPFTTSLANMSRYPSKFGDYAASGKPIVATPLREIIPYYKERNIGELSRDDSVESFSWAIKVVIQKKEHWEGMGVEARKLANEKFNWDKLTNDILQIYNKLRKL